MSWEPHKPAWALKDSIGLQIWKAQATWRIRFLVKDWLWLMPWSWQLGVKRFAGLVVIRVGPFGFTLRWKAR